MNNLKKSLLKVFSLKIISFNQKNIYENYESFLYWVNIH